MAEDSALIEKNTASSSDDPDISEHSRLVAEIQLYDKEADKWNERGKRIKRRYKDEKDNGTYRDSASAVRYNILWSNIQTLLPALYAKNPKPNIERRFKDNEALGRVSSEILERSISYFINTDKFSQANKQAVLDRLLPGRGTVWIRYVPHFRDAAVQGIGDAKDEGVEVTDDIESEAQQEIHYEEVAIDYVHSEDYGHNVCRVEEEVYLKWRKVYLDRNELVERFGGEVGNKITLDYTPKGLKDQKISAELNKATVYEMWDKKKRKAFWVHKDYQGLLDKIPDPLRLPDFFPCPRPLLATTANDSLIPVPDYVEYQDQAIELDDLTNRISSIKKSLKVAGVYDASAEGLERIFSEGIENKIIPVEQWALMAEKGGMKGVMSLLPMQEIAETLLSLYEAREETKKDIYEITGMSDIMRGATDPDETAKAQQLKGQYTNMRLKAQQDEVQRFARDEVRIMANIVAEHFQIDTIKQISGVKLFTNAEKQQVIQQIQMQAQQQAAQTQQTAQQPGQPSAPPKPPDIPDDLQEMLDNPTWEDVEQLFRNDALRCFRIDIETDSTIQADENAEKDDRVQFLEATGNFMQGAMKVAEQAPELTSLMGELLRFGVQAFRVSKPLEGAFNVAIKNMEKKSKAAMDAPPKPDPEMAKVQGQIQIQQAQAQGDMINAKAKIEQDQAAAQADLQLDIQRMQFEEKMKERQLQMEFTFKMRELKAKTAVESGNSPGESVDFDDQLGRPFVADSILADSLTHLAKTVAASTEATHNHHVQLLKAVTAPKTLVRDGSGRVTSAVTQMP